MASETPVKSEQTAVDSTSVPAKRERSASPAKAAVPSTSAPTGPSEEDAFNNDGQTAKKPKFEKMSKKDFKPKSPYPGRGKNRDRPQLSEEERKAKAEERERLRVERRIADEERLENMDDGDRRLPKRRCALLLG